MTNQDIEHMLFRTMEGEVIRSLLSGNDTQCFTTEQYGNARDNWIAGMVGKTRDELLVPSPPSELTRKQLRGSGLVVEVKPDIWVLSDGENYA